MKIDLHLHTIASKRNGDVIQFDSVYDSLKKIYNNNIKIASFTDHNVFDVKIYKTASELSKTAGILFLPGIEINVVRKNGAIGHMLIIFEDNLSDENLLEISEIAKNKIWKNGISINSINSLYSNFNTIRIIHIGKSDFFGSEDLENLEYDAFEVTNLNHSNFKNVIKKGYESSIVGFSDTHIWKHYPEINTIETIIPELKDASFIGLKNVLKLKKNFIIDLFKEDNK